MMGKKEVTDDKGTKRPKFFGVFGLSTCGLLDIQDPGVCSILVVGWKYFQFFRKLYFWNTCWCHLAILKEERFVGSERKLATLLSSVAMCLVTSDKS